MKFLKASVRILILLIVAVLAVFFFFEPQDISNGEVVGEVLKQDAWDFLRSHQKSETPVGINQDLINISLSIFYLLISIDLYRKNSFINMIVGKTGEIEGLNKLMNGKGMKLFVPFIFCSSAFILLVSVYSFFKYLPDILTFVEWSKSLNSRSSSVRSVQVWSSGWSLVLCDFSAILFHAGILRLIYKAKQLKKSNF